MRVRVPGASAREREREVCESEGESDSESESEGEKKSETESEFESESESEFESENESESESEIESDSESDSESALGLHGLQIEGLRPTFQAAGFPGPCRRRAALKKTPCRSYEEALKARAASGPQKQGRQHCCQQPSKRGPPEVLNEMSANAVVGPLGQDMFFLSFKPPRHAKARPRGGAPRGKWDQASANVLFCFIVDLVFPRGCQGPTRPLPGAPGCSC